MRQQPFEDQHRAHWEALRGWLEDQPTLDPQDVPAAYRQLCHHLAIARERRYGAALVEHLSQLALALHRRLYGDRGLEGLRGLPRLALEIPRAARREWRLVLAALLLLGLPFLGAFLAIRHDPDLIHLVLSPQEAARMVSMYSPSGVEGLEASGARRDVTMFGFYVFNNIGIDFQCFASGLLGGLGPAFILVFNGLHLGAVSAHLVNQGLTRAFYGFTSGHTAPEMMGSVLSGAAGLRLGLALLHPGRRSRGDALREAGRASVPLVAGAALLTLAAAFVEAFWSAGTWAPLPLKIGVGVAAWGVVLAWLGLVGREGA